MSQLRDGGSEFLLDRPAQPVQNDVQLRDVPPGASIDDEDATVGRHVEVRDLRNRVRWRDPVEFDLRGFDLKLWFRSNLNGQ